MQTDHIRDRRLENLELSLSLLFAFLCFIVLSLLTNFFSAFLCSLLNMNAQQLLSIYVPLGSQGRTNL